MASLSILTDSHSTASRRSYLRAQLKPQKWTSLGQQVPTFVSEYNEGSNETRGIGQIIKVDLPPIFGFSPRVPHRVRSHDSRLPKQRTIWNSSHSIVMMSILTTKQLDSSMVGRKKGVVSSSLRNGLMGGLLKSLALRRILQTCFWPTFTA
jgi:hypothetical protein